MLYLQRFVNFCLVLINWEIWKFIRIVKVTCSNRNSTINEILQTISGARYFIARTWMSRRHEQVLNTCTYMYTGSFHKFGTCILVLEKLKQTQTRQ